jgi:hypothetical protein
MNIWTGFNGLRTASNGEICETCNEISGFIKLKLTPKTVLNSYFVLFSELIMKVSKSCAICRIVSQLPYSLRKRLKKK